MEGFPTFLKCHVLKAAELPEAKTARRGEAVLFCVCCSCLSLLWVSSMWKRSLDFFFQNIVIFYNSMIVGEIMQKMTTPNYLSGNSRADLIFMFLRTLFWRDKHVGFRMG